jgi:hypothetical protein
MALEKYISLADEVCDCRRRTAIPVASQPASPHSKRPKMLSSVFCWSVAIVMAATLDDETFSLADHNRPIRRGKKKKTWGPKTACMTQTTLTWIDLFVFVFHLGTA